MASNTRTKVGSELAKDVTNRGVDTGLMQSQGELNKQQASLHQYYLHEEKVRVVGSPMYRPYFGNVMNLTINGIAIYVPLDGQAYEIPKTFADLFNSRIADIDEMQRVRDRMANVANNHERYAGELDLIHVV